MKRTPLIVLGLLAGFGAATVEAQNAAYLQGLYIASDGSGRNEAPGAEGSIGLFHNEFLQSMGMRSRGNTELALRSLGEQSVFGRIATMQSVSDSNDVAVAVVIGAWRKDPTHVEFSSLMSSHSDTITLDYLLNFMIFVPVRNTVLFVLAPMQHAFPIDLFQGQRPGVGGGGKYLVVLQPQSQKDFDSSVDAFHELVEKSGETEAGDNNKDGMLSMTEWLVLFGQLARPEFTVLPYRIIEGPDIQLKQLQ